MNNLSRIPVELSEKTVNSWSHNPFWSGVVMITMADFAASLFSLISLMLAIIFVGLLSASLAWWLES